ncbi:MAG: hypothetical protein JXR68_06340 [Bacteroidales bacterium]|nr:hypothetical protein [Bacteroidales bacterium]
MNKFFAVFLFLAIPAFTYSQTIDAIANLISEEIINEFDKLPKDDTVKVVFSYLFFDDNTQTQLTAELSRKISYNLFNALQKYQNKNIGSKYKNIILIPNTILYNQFNSSIRKNAIIPERQNHSDYWANFKKNNTPDFYIFGSFSLDYNWKLFSINELSITPNTYNGNFSNYNNISVDIDNIELDVDQLNTLVNKNISLNKKNVFDQFMSLTGSLQSQLFEAEFYKVDDAGNVVVKKNNFDTVNTTDTYQIKVKMLEDAFLYVLYFDVEDTLNDPYVYFLSNNNNKFLKDDILFVPKNNKGMKFAAPVNTNLHNSTIRIKIIASKSVFIEDFTKIDRSKMENLLIKLNPDLIYTQDITVIRP